MKTIWKFRLEIVDLQIVEIPDDSEVLHAGLDPQGNLCVWAEVDPSRTKIPVEFVIVGTGLPVPDFDCEYIGSVLMNVFVWHVYMRMCITRMV